MALKPLTLKSLRSTGAGLGLAVAFAALAAVQAQAQSLKDFQDWTVGCDNLRRCAAIGLEKKPESVGAYLRVTRSGSANASPQVEIAVYAEKRTDEARLKLAFDDPALPTLADIPVGQEGGLDYVKAPLSDAAYSFIGSLRRAATLSVTLVQGGKAAKPAVISLSGATAALLFMDEQQKRVGSVTALVAQGDKPASSLPAPQAAPVIHAAKPPSTKPPETMPEAVRQAAAKADCDEPATADPIMGKLDERTTLWGVLCSRGAYNYTYAFYLHRTGARTAAPVAFEMPAFLGERERTTS